MFAPYRTEKEEVSVETNPHSLDALITWLRNKPGNEICCYSNSGHCLAAQYCRSIGEKYMVAPIAQYISSQPESWSALPFYKQMELIAIKRPHTFEAALEQANAVKAEI